MTDQPTTTQAAGRELDATVQRVVFGSLVEMDPDGPRYIQPASHAYTGQRVPHYSTDIAAAWLVRAKLREFGQTLTLEEDISREETPKAWRALFCDEVESEGYGATAEESICRAALAYMSLPDEE